MQKACDFQFKHVLGTCFYLIKYNYKLHIFKYKEPGPGTIIINKYSVLQFGYSASLA